MLRSRGGVGLAMIDAIAFRWRRIRGETPGVRYRRAGDANFDRMNLGVMRRRNEPQIVFVADEFGDLRENRREILPGPGKIGAASCGFRDSF